MKPFTKWNRPKKVYEKGGGKLITEQFGNVSTKDQITRFLTAGISLANYRKEQYDILDDVKPDFDDYDLARTPNFDLADASQIKQSALERAKKMQKLNKDKAANDKAAETKKAETPQQENDA
jgi:hypothetical protein